MKELDIIDLSCEADGRPILKNLNLTIKKGDSLALLGPNGHGKSTLLNVILGNPNYKVTSGKILLDGEDLLKRSTDERSKKGIFMAFQNPPDVPGVVTMDFFRARRNAHQEKPVSLLKFYQATTKAYEEVSLDSSMASRHLNEGYSGGEKKRNEIIQMKLLKPDFAMLDEIDSGLDVDAIKIVADNIINLQKETNMALIIVSHYERLYNLVNPTYAHVLVDGRIIAEGDKSLVDKIDAEGYNWLLKEKNISLEQPKKQVLSLGSCANNRGQ